MDHLKNDDSELSFLSRKRAELLKYGAKAGVVAAIASSALAACTPSESEGPAPTPTETHDTVNPSEPTEVQTPETTPSTEVEQPTEGIGVFPEDVEALETLVDPADFEIPAGDYSADELANLVVDRENTWASYFMTPETYDDFAGYLESAQEDFSDWSYEDFTEKRAKAVKNIVVGTLVSEDSTITENGGNIVKDTTEGSATNLALYLVMHHSEENEGVDYTQDAKVIEGTPHMEAADDGTITLSFVSEFTSNISELPAYTGDSNGYQLSNVTYTLRTEGETLKIVSRDVEVAAE